MDPRFARTTVFRPGDDQHRATERRQRKCATTAAHIHCCTAVPQMADGVFVTLLPKNERISRK
jgi:hypothetical protein